MPRTLMVVDLTNLAARCSLGGPVAPRPAADTACNMVARAAAALGVTHLVAALDGGGHTWRHTLTDGLPEPERYKFGRGLDTRPYSDAAAETAHARGWCVLREPAVEADDKIATVVHRAATQLGAYDVVIYSGDSDALALVQAATDLRGSVAVCWPMAGGHFELRTPAEVRARYGVAPHQLGDFKALAGEAGDNVAGLGGRTPKGRVAERPALARKLLAAHGSLDGVLARGEWAMPWSPRHLDPLDRVARDAYVRRDALRLAQQLVTLRTDVELPPLSSRLTAYPAAAAATTGRAA